MLLAEIHGKYDVAVRDNEDYLTSTVFSHLRYVPPGPFWVALFSRAKTLAISGEEKSLPSVLGEDHHLACYEHLDIRFWPTCSGLGEPELAMCFTGGDQTPLVVLVEIKLWSAKSGQGQHDQLMRYLRIADSIDRLTPSVPSNATVVVTYLTPREASNEVQDSLIEYGDTDINRRRIFRLQWQDMIVAITEVISNESRTSQLILNDVRDFLRVRRLEYFRGFSLPAGIESVRDECGSFYDQEAWFNGFKVVVGLNHVHVIKGAWCNAN